MIQTGKPKPWDQLFLAPWHFLLLIAFFLTDGCVEFPGLLPFTDLAAYFGMAAAITFAAYFLFRYLFRSAHKAALLVTTATGLYLFYGTIQDALAANVLGKAIYRDHKLLPLLAGLLLLLGIILGRTKRPLLRLTRYLNTLLLVLLLLNGGRMGMQAGWGTSGAHAVTSKPAPVAGRICDTCAKPDIFLLLLDEYTGLDMLREKWDYSNDPFVRTLREQQFFVADHPSSNYSYTPFSMAATFEMEYPGWVKDLGQIQAQDYTYAANRISGSTALRYLQGSGYRLVNNSIFDIQDQPSQYDPGFLSLKFQLLTARTCWPRLKRSWFWGINVGRFFRLGGPGEGNREMVRKGNQGILDRVYALAGDTAGGPRFVYTHLMLPHEPFLYDSLGRPAPPVDAGVEGSTEGKKAAYLQYLVHANGVVGKLVRHIREQTGDRAVILVLSDHGFRQMDMDWVVKNINNNFSAVYLPKKNYESYYDTLSNVNQFRVLFNSLFDAGFTVLKDSCVF
ncbi:MAG: hypothetical protein P0Y53_23935 [Candidatus Pseudobacter hemicellulosilyticus]|uniref:Sulfatase N-terminal domain-containing protein n=1 Tax=Candidatus Pseudobacter hemicellulosilyticus TaxID=3121375 RepID=A0AAJ5WRV7_9BACT|nr:MAG: hypothetical protein P0Y53_23935 [Pseudobacter sp.]